MKNEDHQCRLCGAYFIPFKEDIECPRCGVRATDEAVEDHARFIPELVWAMQLNKARQGSFMPQEWSVKFMVNDAQLLMFELFSELEKKKPKNKKAFIKKTIHSIGWDEGGDLEAHLLDIALAVLKMRIDRNLDCEK